MKMNQTDKKKRERLQHSNRENYYWHVPENIKLIQCIHKTRTIFTSTNSNSDSNNQPRSNECKVYIIELHLTIDILMWCVRRQTSRTSRVTDGRAKRIQQSIGRAGLQFHFIFIPCCIIFFRLLYSSFLESFSAFFYCVCAYFAVGLAIKIKNIALSV